LIYIAAFGVLVGLGFILRMQAGRLCVDSRSIRLQLPIETVWEMVRDYGGLQAAHGRGRPLLDVRSSEVRLGDGVSPGTVWRQRGRWGEEPWWAEIEIVAIEPPRKLEVRLARDVFATHQGLARHRCILELEPDGPDATKLFFTLDARTRGLRVTLARTVSPERVHARLLDVGLRSLKMDLESRAYVEPERGGAWPGVPEIYDGRLAPVMRGALPMRSPSPVPFLQEQA
jgi:uncharacterized protein YndB with AHSA1/START domain